MATSDGSPVASPSLARRKPSVQVAEPPVKAPLGRRVSNVGALIGQPHHAASRTMSIQRKNVFMTAFTDGSVDGEEETGDGTATTRTGAMLPSGRPRVLYENTYRIMPEPSTKFHVGHAKSAVDSMLAQQMEAAQIKYYDADRAKKFCLQLANSAKRAVKHTLHIPRYKVVAFVVVGQDGGQDFRFTSRCLWLPQTDNFIQTEVKVGNMFAVCTVFAVYFE